MQQLIFISCLNLFLRSPGTATLSVAWVPDVKDGVAASEASLSFTLGKATDSVKRAGRLVQVLLKRVSYPHTLIGG